MPNGYSKPVSRCLHDISGAHGGKSETLLAAGCGREIHGGESADRQPGQPFYLFPTIAISISVRLGAFGVIGRLRISASYIVHMKPT